MEEAKIQLFCVPFAGGNGRSFQGLADLLPSFIEVIQLEYPGRGKRAKEPFFDNIQDLIFDVDRQISEFRNPKFPYALLGYSMGSAVSYDLMQYVRKDLPIHVFLCAREVLTLPSETKKFALLSFDEFISRVQKMGGVDERIAHDERFLKMFMKPVYADYQLWYQYKCKPELGCPEIDTTIFYCEKDTPWHRVKEWPLLIKGNIDFYEFGENHFFLFKHAAEMAEIIADKLNNKL